MCAYDIAYEVVFYLISAPNKICALEISSVTVNSATISWKVGEVTKNTDIENFTVELYELSSNQGKSIIHSCTLPASQTEYTVEKLNCSKTYEFQISAENKTGQSESTKCE